MIEEPWLSLIFIGVGAVVMVAVALTHDWTIARAAARRRRDAASHAAE